jgi:hypothetical protein
MNQVTAEKVSKIVPYADASVLEIANNQVLRMLQDH